MAELLLISANEALAKTQEAISKAPTSGAIEFLNSINDKINDVAEFGCFKVTDTIEVDETPNLELVKELLQIMSKYLVASGYKIHELNFKDNIFIYSISWEKSEVEKPVDLHDFKSTSDGKVDKIHVILDTKAKKGDILITIIRQSDGKLLNMTAPYDCIIRKININVEEEITTSTILLGLEETK